MRAPRPLLVVSCPGRTVASTRQEVSRARDAGADVAEVRLDRWPPEERARAAELFPSSLPLLATLRSRAEGGEGPDAPDVRAVELRRLASLPFRFLDLERQRDGPLARQLGAGPADGPSLVVSEHRPRAGGTDASDLLRPTERPARGWVKLVTACDFPDFWQRLLPMVRATGDAGPFVVHTTGPTGALLRAWSRRFGMAAVYCALPGGTDAAVEPSQIPVDRLLRYLDTDSARALFGVVGHPIDHSRSPEIHSRWYAREGRAALYLALDIGSARDFAEAVEGLVDGGLRGLNVTHPWKVAALSLASRAGPSAEAAGCANTISVEGGALRAENTDVAAVQRRLTELRASGAWADSSAVVLGAGGAARAALVALSALGARARVLARERSRAESLAREFGAEVHEPSSGAPVSLVIHATPAGRADVPALALDWSGLVGPGTQFVDFVYRAPHRFLEERVRSRGGTYEDGSRLLVYQAAASYALWWGEPPPLEAQDESLREDLCAA